MSKKNKIGLIGYGLMGHPMGLNWLKKGFELNVLPHKNKIRIEDLQRNGAQIAGSLKDLAQNSEIIILMLPTSREVESILLGPNSLESFAKPEHIVIDMSTSEPESTKKIGKIYQEKNLRFFDSPVTGGVKGATEGTLTLFVGGPTEYFEESLDVLKAVSNMQRHFGETGSGHMAKVINNFVCIGNLAVFSEALPLAVKMGIDARAIFETLASGTGASRMLDLYGEQILRGDFAPRYKLVHALKDLNLAKNLIDELKISLPVFNGIFQDLRISIEKNLGEENISAMIKPVEDLLHSKFRS